MDFRAESSFVVQHPDVRRRAIAGYFGSITHIDFQVNRLMEVLSDFGLRENTAVLFVSDHGDMMGDHDRYHKTVGYEGSARVPFLVRLPGERTVLPRVDEVVELRDIMPTVLDIAGVPIPAGVDGVSVLPLMEGAQVPWRSEIHGEHVAELFGNESMHWVTDGRRKFIWFSGPGMEQFFDLDGDPTESRNVVNQPDWAEEVADWRNRLVANLHGREEGYVSDGRLVAGRPVQTELSWVRALLG